MLSRINIKFLDNTFVHILPSYSYIQYAYAFYFYFLRLLYGYFQPQKREENMFCHHVQNLLDNFHERKVMHWPALAITLGSLLPALIIRL